MLGLADSNAAASGRPVREMAVTFDDLPGVVAPGEGVPELRAITEKLVRAIAGNGIPAIGFVKEGKLAPQGTPEPERVALLSRWISAGLELGNHTYSHVDLHKASLDQFEEDVVRGEETTNPARRARHSPLRPGSRGRLGRMRA